MTRSEELRDLIGEHAKYNPERARGMAAALAMDSVTMGYCDDLRARATLQNRSVEELILSDRSLLSESRFPSPDCLKAVEVLHAAWGRSLPNDRQLHFDSCAYCQLLVRTSLPDEQGVENLSIILANGAQATAPVLALASTAKPAPVTFFKHLPAAVKRFMGGFVALAACLLVFVFLNFNRTGEPDFRAQLASKDVGPSKEETAASAAAQQQLIADSQEIIYRFNHGDDERVIQLADLLLDNAGEDAITLALRGQSYSRLGNRQNAYHDLSAALRLDSGNQVAANAIRDEYVRLRKPVMDDSNASPDISAATRLTAERLASMLSEITETKPGGETTDGSAKQENE